LIADEKVGLFNVCRCGLANALIIVEEKRKREVPWRRGLKRKVLDRR